MKTYINKQVLPQAPSPTMTSFRLISAIFERKENRISRVQAESGRRSVVGVVK